MSKNKDDKKITRRQFLYTLGGAATGAAIGGWVLNMANRTSHLPPNKSKIIGAVPKLRPDVKIIPNSAGAEIYDCSASDMNEPICAVNRIGLQVIQKLDGQKTVDEITQETLAYLPTQNIDFEAAKKSIIMFIADIGSAGLLTSPFYINIYSNEIWRESGIS